MRRMEIFTRCLLGRCKTEDKISSPLGGLLWSRGLNWAILLSSHQPWAFTTNAGEKLTSPVEECIFCKLSGYMPLMSGSLSISYSFTHSLCSTPEAQGRMKWRFLHLSLHHRGPNPSSPTFPGCLGSRLTLWADLRCHEREFPHSTPQSWKWIFLWIHYKLCIAFDMDLSPRTERHPENLSLRVKKGVITCMTRVLTHFFRVLALR